MGKRRTELVPCRIAGLAVSRGIAIGRAVVAGAGQLEIARYYLQPEQVEAEITRLKQARDAVSQELQRLQTQVPADAPPELAALLDVHLMLLDDEVFLQGVQTWIRSHLYNAEWALLAHTEEVGGQFDEMEDAYLRQRKADLEQVTDRWLHQLKGKASPVAKIVGNMPQTLIQKANEALVLVAKDLSPADMLQFRQSQFSGFVTEVGGKTSHTAIVARSMDVPAVVGARGVLHQVHHGDWVVVDGEAGEVVLNPEASDLEAYRARQQAYRQAREGLLQLRDTPATTLDGQAIELLANIEQPGDAATAMAAGAMGVGLFRSEFLFMGRADGQLPDEQEQFAAYREAVEASQGRVLTIRTIDVGADKPLHGGQRELALNPALGLRAIRWSLAEPEMFRTQLRAMLRAAALGPVRVLVPMLAHLSEIHATLAQLEQARAELQAQGVAYGSVQIGAMIEVPAAALMVQQFLPYFDFVSIGTNDLIQYTLAIDRTDEAVAHLYDPLHPAVLRLLAEVVAEGARQGKSVSLCGEMAGDPDYTGLLLGLGLRSFSMQPAQLLTIKQRLLNCDSQQWAARAQAVLQAPEPARLLRDWQ